MATCMRLCYKLQIWVFLLSLLIIGVPKCVIASQPGEFIRKLQLPGSFDVSFHEFTENFHVYSIIYKVRLAYPAANVVQFYDDVLISDGWNPFVDPHYRYADRVWQEYFDATKEGMPLVHQLIAQWQKGDRIALLGIRYYSFEANRSGKNGTRVPSNDVLNVYFQLMPFVAGFPPGTILPQPPAE